MFCCSRCGKSFAYVYLYLSHIRNFHRYDPNFKYYCGFNDCPITSNTFSAFKKHLYKHDELKTGNVSARLTCKTCGFYSYSKCKFSSHFKNHTIISCPLKKCHRSYTNYSSFKSHLSINHSYYTVNDFKSEFLTPPKTEIINHQLSQVDHDAQLFFNSVQSTDYNRNAALFTLKMQEKFLLPHSVTVELINGVQELQNDAISLIKQSIMDTLRENNVDECVLNLVSNNSTVNLSSPFDVMKSEHLQRKYLKENLNFIEPVEYVLKSNTQISNYQYVPILENIKAFCKNSDVFDYIVSNNVNDVNDVNILSDIHDGTVFKHNPLFQTFPNLQILLYFDEFMPFNPLRGNQANHKLSALYFTLGNFPSKYRSCVKDVQLAVLCRSSDLKHFGFHAVFEPLIKDLKTLETVGINISGIPNKVKGGIVAIIGDNLAAHQIGGYVTCFSGNVRCCRFCMAKKCDMQTIFMDSKFVRRTKDMYNHHLSLVNMDAKYTAVYGLKFNSPFNDLKYFHCSTMLPPDAMHDLLEGVVPFELRFILKHLILNKYITLSQLNYKINNSKLGHYDSLNRPREISENFQKGIKMTAARTWCFLRLLPMLIGNNVPESEPAWCLLLQLKEIVNIVLAPKINVNYISYLADLIKDHHSIFKELFPTITLTPKFHFLVHYPQLILEFGPLTCSWSMRFEAKHLYFKRIAQNIKNSINLPYSLAKRHQQLQCYYNLENLRSVGKSDIVTSGKIVDKKSYPGEIAGLLAGYEDFYSLKKIELNGIVYKTGMCLVSGFNSNGPIFEKIIIILRKGTITKFICRTFASNEFFHIGGFQLENSYSVKILNLENFIDVYPLSLYKYNSSIVVIPKYLVLDTES